MGLEQASIAEIVNKTLMHKWGVPEFQRAFVWTPQRVRDLIDSLWRGYPVGSFLIWYASDDVVTRGPNDAHLADAWVVDGQQRTTALCLLLGRKLFWWESDWNQLLAKNDVRFNVLILGKEWEGLAVSAVWDDLRIGLSKFSKWRRCAFVTDRAWIQHATKAFGWLSPGEVNVFEVDELSDAMACTATAG